MQTNNDFEIVNKTKQHIINNNLDEDFKISAYFDLNKDLQYPIFQIYIEFYKKNTKVYRSFLEFEYKINLDTENKIYFENNKDYNEIIYLIGKKYLLLKNNILYFNNIPSIFKKKVKYLKEAIRLQLKEEKEINRFVNENVEYFKNFWIEDYLTQKEKNRILKNINFINNINNNIKKSLKYNIGYTKTY